MKFLIVKPSSLGDILHAFPAARILSEAFDHAELHWVVHPAFEPILRYLPCVTRTILFDRKAMGKLRSFPQTAAAYLRAVRAERYDAVFDLQGLMRSALLARAAKAPVHAGFRTPTEPFAKLFYSAKLNSGEPHRHAILKNSDAIRSFLRKPTTQDETRPDSPLPILPDPAERIARRLAASLSPTAAANRKLVVVSPGARWATKQWPPSFFAAVMRGLSERVDGLYFILSGGNADRDASRAILSDLPEGFPISDWTGETTLEELVELTRRAALFYCNDSGPMHIAAALGVPVAAHFGPTSSVLTGPFSEKSIVLAPELPCISCFKRYCDKELCHTALNPDQTADTVAEFLKKESPR